jgi:hypothetical protein
MATEQTGTEGAGAAAPAVGRRPAQGANGSPRPSRDEVIAGLTRLTGGGETEGKPETPEPEAKPETKPEPAPLPEPDEDGEEDTKEDAEPEPEAPVDPKADPDLAKRLAIVAKHEKRAKAREAEAKAAIEAERHAFRREREQAERDLSEARAEIEAFEKFKSRARYDAAGALKALGFDVEDFGPAARQLWAHTKEAQADPKNRDAADRLMKEREAMDRIGKLERELEARTKAEQQREAQARIANKVETYLDGVSKAVKAEDHPLAKRLVEKSPDKARLRFAEIARDLSERDDGDLPDADDVLAEYERRTRAELEEHGADVAALIKPKAAKAANSNEATRTLGNDVGSTTAPKASTGKKTHEQKRAELERELRAIDLKA